MLVKDWMIKDVITIDANSPMQQAINLMMENDINILPVTEAGHLVGIVTDRDIRSASPSDSSLLDFQQVLYRISRLTVWDIMSRDVVTVALDHTVEETAEILLSHKFSGCPVVDDEGQIRGIITKIDLFKVLITVTGLHEKGVQFGLLLEDRLGAIQEITDLMRQHSVRIVSLLGTSEKAPEGYRKVYIRLFHPGREKLPQLIQKLRGMTKILYMVDHEENNREIYEE